MKNLNVAGVRSAGAAALRVRTGNALLAGLLVSVTSVFTTDAAAQTRFLRQPSVSATEIAFVHANDRGESQVRPVLSSVWCAGREGDSRWLVHRADMEL